MFIMITCEILQRNLQVPRKSLIEKQGWYPRPEALDTRSTSMASAALKVSPPAPHNDQLERSDRVNNPQLTKPGGLKEKRSIPLLNQSLYSLQSVQ